MKGDTSQRENKETWEPKAEDVAKQFGPRPINASINQSIYHEPKETCEPQAEDVVKQFSHWSINQ